eukprot:4930441-Pleurochrysis_carterae.AAC.1
MLLLLTAAGIMGYSGIDLVWESPAAFAGFYFGTLAISSIWLIDYFGGATDIGVADYYAAA